MRGCALRKVVRKPGAQKTGKPNWIANIVINIINRIERLGQGGLRSLEASPRAAEPAHGRARTLSSNLPAGQSASRDSSFLPSMTAARRLQADGDVSI